jgi:glutathione S-transferase
MNRTVNVTMSYAASVARLGLGQYVGALGKRPEKPLELYEFENCPFCRKVREALSVLDLDAFIYPCPKGGTRFRPRAAELGGKQQFPYLVDPNTGQRMYESNAIVRYLFETYGDGKVHTGLALGPLTTASSVLASWTRGLGGSRAQPGRAPEKPLELWSFEVSPYCRLVRETLCRLELPYLLHNVAKGSPRRPDFIARSGRMMVPYLADPNTGAAMFESSDIIAYLEKTYGASGA